MILLFIIETVLAGQKFLLFQQKVAQALPAPAQA
jgi:hypothetical protein